MIPVGKYQWGNACYVSGVCFSACFLNFLLHLFVPSVSLGQWCCKQFVHEEQLLSAEQQNEEHLDIRASEREYSYMSMTS